MTHHAPPAPPPPTPPTPPEQPVAAPAEAPPERGRRRALIAVCILVAFILVYGLSLFGVHMLAKSAGPLKPPDLNATNDTVVLIHRGAYGPCQ